MFALRGLRNALRTAARTTPRTTLHPIHPLRQQRWATYQRFPLPNRGGKSSRQQTYSKFIPFARAQYMWYNYQTPILVVGAGGGAFYVYNLEQVPITKRRRFNCISPEQEKAVAGGGYEQVLSQYKGRVLPANHPYTQMVSRVVSRLLSTTHGLAGDSWKVHVIDDKDMVNAFVMPGGNVFVFTGILPICEDENGLAAVLGHEIAHNLAHHAAERMSRSLPIMAVSVLGAMLFDVSGQLSNSLASLLLELPNSRTQETEADYIGLLMMAESCYDPNRVPDLWKRMAQAEKYAPPQFLSTHPASAARAETIKKWLPEANEKYAQSGCAMTNTYSNEFKKVFSNQPRPRGLPSDLSAGGPPRNSNDDGDDFF